MLAEFFISVIGIFFLSSVTCFSLFALTHTVLTTAYAYPFVIFLRVNLHVVAICLPPFYFISLEWPIPAGETLW